MHQQNDPLKAESLWQYIWQLRGRLRAIFLLAIVRTLLLSPLPLLFKILIDDYLETKDLAGVWIATSIGLGLIFLHIVVAQFGIRTMSRRIPHIVAELRSRVFHKLNFMRFSFLDGIQTGRLLSRYAYDTQRIEMALIPLIHNLIPGIIHSLFMIAILVILNWKLTAIILLILPAILVVRLFYAKRVQETNESSRRAHEGLTGQASEFISAIRLVRGFGQEKTVTESLDSKSDSFAESRRRQIIANQGMGMMAFVISKALTILIIAVGVTFAINGALSVGSLFAFVGALPQIIAPIDQITAFSQTYTQGDVGYQSIRRLVSSSYVESWKGRHTFNPLRGDIRFRNVTFTYKEDGPATLRDVDLWIRPGEHVAFVGPSGSGKSTIVNLLLGLYAPQSGEIQIDGVPQAQIDMRALRRQSAIVMQESLLLSGSIAENIRFGRPWATDEQVREAARQANALEFIETLENGFQTAVGERGVSLSGGQRQRLAIARALLRDPGILILDEATSALDYESEKVVQEALDRLAKGRTVITIAHRLSTVRAADRIVVLREGQIVEQGPYQELANSQDSYFSELLAAQSS